MTNGEASGILIKLTARGERIEELRQRREAKKVSEKSKKELDKRERLCYNKHLPDGARERSGRDGVHLVN